METDKVIVKIAFHDGTEKCKFKLVEIQRNSSYEGVVSALKATSFATGDFDLYYHDQSNDQILINCSNDLNIYFRLISGNYRWECVNRPKVAVKEHIPEKAPATVNITRQVFAATDRVDNAKVRPQSNVRTVAMPKLNARFVKHVTCDDEGSTYAPGTKFFKTWRFRNDGGLKWPKLIHLLFVSKLTGDSMSGPETMPIQFPEQIELGKEIDISVPLIAPEKTGEYTGFWKLADETGKKFGQRVRVRITVTDSATVPKASMSIVNSVVKELKDNGFTDDAIPTARYLMTRRQSPLRTYDDVETALGHLGVRVSLN